MWGAFLSEPLRIVGSVVRYTTDYLMRRMPIPVRIAPFLPRRCLQSIYAGLALLSQGCPPDRGRLHTCYSPVRRSPAKQSKLCSPLPLDLHVLSLPLAFILSQDQTLRCYVILRYLFALSCRFPCAVRMSCWLLTGRLYVPCCLCLSQCFQCAWRSADPRRLHPVSVLRVQSYADFSCRPNIFATIFRTFCL